MRGRSASSAQCDHGKATAEVARWGRQQLGTETKAESGGNVGGLRPRGRGRGVGEATRPRWLDGDSVGLARRALRLAAWKAQRPAAQRSSGGTSGSTTVAGRLVRGRWRQRRGHLGANAD
ncbi:hypothetical protein ZWY2020_033874 [Hordeum vulgare]|nr:hypothetical protein ZWY2020_033874 [Hordeum vulgare]